MIDFTIIGGGVIGLFLATELKEKFPNKEVIILEQEPFCGDHTSGRNSGVIHSGIYYPTNSKKHLFCLEGNKLWADTAKKLNVEINRCGKFIFATKEQEAQLSNFLQQAKNNNVSTRLVTPEELSSIQEFVFAENAIFISSTGIIDTSSVIKALEYECEKKEAYILRNHKVTEITIQQNGFEVIAGEERIQTSMLFNCAGLHAVDIRKKLGLRNLENQYVRGTYFKTYQKYFKDSLLYPIPKANLKGLGVHTTFDQDTLRFGPDTEDISSIDYQLNERNLAKMKAEIPNVFKGIDLQKVTPDYCGIRPKILLDGTLYTDFWIQTDKETKIAGYFEFCGIESPGLTSAPAIAKHIVSTL
jgi:L-2-hydroxyglutarate oxidase LhgO